ncbi:MAG: NPCBM/NEW2 domain-containing protein [Phycisphaerales bacterium]
MTTPHRLVTLAGAVGAVSLASLASAQPTSTRSEPGPRVLLIDDQFNASHARLVGLDSGGVTVEDSFGTRTRLAPGSVLALVTIDGAIDPDLGIGGVVAPEAVESARAARIGRALSAAMQGFVETTRGLRYPGVVSPTAASGDAVAWQHPEAGRIEIPLDDISRILSAEAASEGPPPRRSQNSDELVLSNGDVLSGFLLSVGPITSIETEAGNIVDLPIDRVAAALLANPKQPMTGTMIWLDDGSTFSAEALTATGSAGIRVTLPGGGTVEYDPQTLRAIAFEAAGILPLSDLPPQSQEAVGERVFVEPIRTLRHPDDLAFGSAPTLNALDIDLPGPMRVTWTLPPGIVRFAGTAALADTSGGWGDCEYSVWLDGERVFSSRLHKDQPAAAFNVETQGAIELTVLVDPGNFGPIRDRVFLHRPLLQIER